MNQPDLLGPVLAYLKERYEDGAAAYTHRELMELVAQAINEAVKQEPIR